MGLDPHHPAVRLRQPGSLPEPRRERHPAQAIRHPRVAPRGAGAHRAARRRFARRRPGGQRSGDLTARADPNRTGLAYWTMLSSDVVSPASVKIGAVRDRVLQLGLGLLHVARLELRLRQVVARRRAARIELDEPLVPAVEDQLGATPNVELLVDAVQVGLYGALADVQLLGDLSITQAGSRHAEDVDLADREDFRDFSRARLPPEEDFEVTSVSASLHPLLARMHLANALDQEPRRHLLEHDAAYSQAARLDQLLFVEGGCEQHDARGQLLALDRVQDRNTVAAGHANVQHENVGAVCSNGFQCGLAVRALSLHSESPLAPEQILHGAEHEGVVVGQDDANGLRFMRRRDRGGLRHGDPASTGRLMSSRVPCSVESMIKLPLRAATRSRSVVGPSPSLARAT